jgi:alpha/beta superfamily hydrolase
LAQKLQSQRQIEIDYRVIKGANHLFDDKIEILGKNIESYLDDKLAQAEAG